MLKFHTSALRPCAKTRLPHHGKANILFFKRTAEKKNSNSVVTLDEYSDLQISDHIQVQTQKKRMSS